MIRFENVSKTYPRSGRPALRDVTLEVERGEFVFVVGQSGSGKSTLLRLVLREERATGGPGPRRRPGAGPLPGRKVPALRREIGTVFQDFRLLPNKTVYQNVAFALQVLGRSRHQIRQTVPETLEMVGLDGKEKRLPHELSGGEQQRVAIARAFVNKPAILLVRRAHRQPRPHHQPRHRAAARPDPPRRHHRRHGHPRRRHRRPAAQAGRRARRTASMVRDQVRGVYGSAR